MITMCGPKINTKYPPPHLTRKQIKKLMQIVYLQSTLYQNKLRPVKSKIAADLISQPVLSRALHQTVSQPRQPRLVQTQTLTLQG